MTCATLQEAHQIVRAGVNARRGEAGCKAAIGIYARDIGLPESRVFNLYYGKARQILAAEYLLLRRRAREAIAADIARRDAKTALLRAQYEALGVEI